ncbi:MAG: serine hydrolase domain-containing protein [Gemmatimonadota bacterium]|nr:serine hydrolase domain-containing protein [Gemmatimonadota bacterium]
MTARHPRPGLAVLTGLLLTGIVTPGRLPAQGVPEGYHYDPPTETRLADEGAHARLLNWVEQAGRGNRSQQVMFRNTSDRPIEIVSYRFFDCTNVSGVECGVEIEGPRIEPGETIRLATIDQRDLEQRSFYRYEFRARFIWSPVSPAGVREAPGAGDQPAPRRTTGFVPERFAYVDQVMPFLMRNHAVPGVAIVLVEGPHVQWSAGYGVARPGGPPVTPETVFRAGELGEPVVALALHRLAAFRDWNLASPVSTWAHRRTIPPGLESVSAAAMLAHSGPTADADYALLQRLVEMAEGHDLEVLLRAMVIEPHHLASMRFTPPVAGEVTTGHDRSGELLPAAPSESGDAAGSLFSSSADYARFLVEVSPLAGRDFATWSRLTEPHRRLDEGSGLAWGRGWVVAEAEDGSPIAFRLGAAPGHACLAVVDELRQRALVLFTNGDGGAALAGEVVRFLDPWSAPLIAAYLERGG